MKIKSDNITMSHDGLNIPCKREVAAKIVEVCSKASKGMAVEVKQFREKRSLDSNGYLWLLCDKIAKVISPPLTANEVYYQMIKDYGVREEEPLSVYAKASELLEKKVKYCERYGEGVLDGKLFYHYHVYKGSSEYDSKEMSVLIDGIISECKQLDIETLPPHEVERLKKEWNT